MAPQYKYTHLIYTESGTAMRLYAAYGNGTPLTDTNGFALTRTPKCRIKNAND